MVCVPTSLSQAVGGPVPSVSYNLTDCTKGPRLGGGLNDWPRFGGLGDRMVAVLGPSEINVLIRLSAFLLLCIGIQIGWRGYSALPGAPGS
jgi:hypothetical protein